MDKEFKQEYLCEPFKLDPIEQLYLDAWLVYHRTADRIDGHIKQPRTDQESKTVHLAFVMGSKAKFDFLRENGVDPHSIDMSGKNKKWQWAKMEALRIIERR